MAGVTGLMLSRKLYAFLKRYLNPMGKASKFVINRLLYGARLCYQKLNKLVTLWIYRKYQRKEAREKAAEFEGHEGLYLGILR